MFVFQARDPDSVSSVTYIIKEGADGIFAIDSSTGVIRTLSPLDYEKRSSYTLVVGTLENDGPDPRATATVTVSVEVNCACWDNRFYILLVLDYELFLLSVHF